MTRYYPHCLFCKHFEKGGAPSCDAFPDGIPERILRNKHDHRKPYPNDNGVTFEPVDDEAARIVDAMFREDDDA